MSLDTATSRAILVALESHALTTGKFDRVGRHEPENAPGNGITAAFWVQRIGPARAGSGLSSTTGLLVVNCRVYTSMLSEPADEIDPEMLDAVDSLFVAYCGDFTLGGLIKQVDVRGAHGTELSATAGYLPQDGLPFRVYTLTIPVVANDLWDEAP